MYGKLDVYITDEGCAFAERVNWSQCEVFLRLNLQRKKNKNSTLNEFTKEYAASWDIHSYYTVSVQ